MMRRREIAIILSFIYCGFGQIYKGMILKGLDFIVLYTALFVSFFLFPSERFLLHYFNLFSIIFLWIVGIVDAYLDEEDEISARHSIFWRWVLPSLSTMAIFCSIAVVVLTFLQPKMSLLNSGEKHITLGPSVQPEAGAGTESPASEVKTGKTPEEDLQTRQEKQSNNSAGLEGKTSEQKRYYAVQVGLFMNKDNAENFAAELRKKYGDVYVVPPSYGVNDKLFKIRVGRFKDKYTARKFARTMVKNKDVRAGIVVRESRR